MARRRFFAAPEAFALTAGFVTLGSKETRHLKHVLRMQPGDELFVFDGKGNEYRCQLVAFGVNSATADIIEQVKIQSRSNLELTLAVGLLKGDKFDLVVQKATELGVNRLIPVTTHRADVKIRNEDDAEKKISRWRRIAQEAMKQCGRADEVVIDNPIEFHRLIKDKAIAEPRLLFAERDGTSFAQACNLAESASHITAIVGSEGGWSDDEIRHARQEAWTIVTLEGRTMRAETAAIVVATLLQHRFGDLK
jgi:16S rRNA (uracil1498-N3)-methyltransferase